MSGNPEVQRLAEESAGEPTAAPASRGTGPGRAPPPRSRFTSAFLRGFAIQGSWNYRTLVGGGLAYAMLPLLTYVHAGDPVGLRRSLERNASPFNGHPYLCGVAVGALARLEHDGHDAERIARFRTALAGPLGALGDRAVWAGWRPFCVLMAMAAFALGMSAGEAVLLFLITYNAGHLWLRQWAFRRGWSAGLEVGRVLRDSPLARAGRLLAAANVGLLGAVAVLLAGRLPLDAGPGAALLVLTPAVGIGAYLLPRTGGVASVLLLAAACAAWLL